MNEAELMDKAIVFVITVLAIGGAIGLPIVLFGIGSFIAGMQSYG